MTQAKPVLLFNFHSSLWLIGGYIGTKRMEVKSSTSILAYTILVVDFSRRFHMYSISPPFILISTFTSQGPMCQPLTGCMVSY